MTSTLKPERVECIVPTYSIPMTCVAPVEVELYQTKLMAMKGMMTRAWKTSRSMQISSKNMSFTSRSVSIMSLAMPCPFTSGSLSKNSEKQLKEVKVNLMKKRKKRKKRKDVLMLVTKTVAMAEENGAKLAAC